jgi:hypothetical protein
MISQYKGYIHAELLPSRTEASLGAVFTRTHHFFMDLGHKLQFQVLDNECPASLLRFFHNNMLQCNAYRRARSAPTRSSAPSKPNTPFAAPCGTLLVAHDPRSREMELLRGHRSFLGPALTHCRSYHCFIVDPPLSPRPYRVS